MLLFLNPMLSNFVGKLEQNLRRLFPLDFVEMSEARLHNANTPRLKFLLAVSGGADSVAMLLGFAFLKKKLSFELSVLTVSHNLRAEAESMADALFVQDLCKRLEIDCTIEELSGEKILKYAKLKNCGLEAAARYFRYSALQEQSNKTCSDFILTAHNRNDYYETVLMRLFQGANPESLYAIKPKTGNLIRPLLNFTRIEIIEFLKTKNQDFCTDSTNKSTKYLRNRIRLKLVPALDFTFPNWKKALDKTLEKVFWDCQALEITSFLKNTSFDENSEIVKRLNDYEVEISRGVFENLPNAMRRRVLQKAFSILGLTRVSHNFLKACILLKDGGRCEIGRCGFSFQKKLIVYKKVDSNIAGFSLWIDHKGKYILPIGVLEIIDADLKSSVYLNLCNIKTNALVFKKFGPFNLPFFVRSVFPGDKIQISENTFKSVKKILSESGVDKRNILKVAVIEYKGDIKGIIAESAHGKSRKSFSGKNV